MTESYGGGLAVQIYPTTLVNTSRMLRIGASVQRGCDFAETHLVGVATADLGDETIEPGLSIVRIRGSRRNDNLGRLLRAALWQPKVFWRYRNKPVAAVAAHHVYVLPLAWALSKVTGAALVYNPHELETETPAMHGMKQRGARIIESRLLPKCDIVSTVNDAIADWYAETYPIPRPIVAINVPRVRSVNVRLRERLGVTDDEMLYIHTGHLVEGRNLPAILAAFAGSQHHVVFLGDGALFPAVAAAVTEHSNIHWLPPVHPDLVASHTAEADVGLCLIDTELGLSYKLSAPNKLHESMVVRTPTLCSDMPYARHLYGPELSQTWVLNDPQHDLPAALARISKPEVAAFTASWRRVLDWDAEVLGLVEAYRAVAPSRTAARD